MLLSIAQVQRPSERYVALLMLPPTFIRFLDDMSEEIQNETAVVAFYGRIKFSILHSPAVSADFCAEYNGVKKSLFNA